MIQSKNWKDIPIRKWIKDLMRHSAKENKKKANMQTNIQHFYQGYSNYNHNWIPLESYLMNGIKTDKFC